MKMEAVDGENKLIVVVVVVAHRKRIELISDTPTTITKFNNKPLLCDKNLRRDISLVGFLLIVASNIWALWMILDGWIRFGCYGEAVMGLVRL
jgi:hypothetical protein